MITHDTILLKLKRRCRGAIQAEVARSLGVTPQYLNDVLHARRKAGPQLLRALGLDRRVIYRATNGRN